MAYAAQQDLVDRFGQQEIVALSDRAEPPSGAIDPNVVSRALDDATAEVDAYLSGRHVLPLSPVPQVLVRVTCDIARYRLADNTDLATEEVTRRYEQALSFLKSVAEGKVRLGMAPQDAPASAGAPEFSAPPRTFSQDTLAEF